jgi:hypothetical protein
MAFTGAASLLLSGSATAQRQRPPLGIIDFYGLHRVHEADARAALHFAEGDSAPNQSARNEATARLRAIPGVVSARLDFVCCDDGRSILYVGIEERGALALRFGATPRGTVHVSDDVRRAGDALQKAIEDAIIRGDAADDLSAGHSLVHDPAARALQEQFIVFAARDFANLRDVLRHAGNPEDRALAAEVLAYAADKRRIVPDLVRATRDPAEDVRNNAMRALWGIATLAQRSPGLKIRVRYDTFVDLLQSPVWTDRNKSSLALLELSESRDRTLLAILRARAMPALVEMARWHSAGHAYAGFVLLGRTAGWSDVDIDNAWQRGDRESLLRLVR